MADNLMFRKGSWNELQTLKTTHPEKIQNGTLFFTYDEGDLYLGHNGDLVRIQGSIHQYADLTSFAANVQPPYSSDVVYFIADKNALLRYDDAEGWIQLNITAKDAKLLEEKITSNTNAIEEVSNTVVSHGTRITGLETRMGEAETAINTKASQADFNTLSSTVNTTHANLLAGLRTDVDKKADGEEFAEVKTQVGTNTGDIGTLKNKVNNIETVALPAKADKSAFDTLATTVNTTHAGLLAGLRTDVDSKAAQSDFDEVSAQVNTNSGNIATLQKQVKNINEVALPAKADKSAFDELSVTVNTTHAGLLEGLRTDVDSKASQEAFDEVAAQVNTNKNNISSLTTNKANASDLNALAGRVTTAENSLKTKASDADVKALQTTVNQHDSDITELGGQITALDNSKVTKETGKGLSTNDFTNAYKTKLTNMPAITGLDTVVTDNSNNPVTSDGVFEALVPIKESLSEHAGTLTTHGEDIQDIKDLIGMGGDGSSGSISDRVTALENADVTINQTLESHGNTLKDHGTTLESHTNTLKDHTDDIGELQSQVAGHGTQLSGLDTRMGQAEGRLNTAEKNINTNAGKIATNEGKIAKNIQDIAKNAQDIAANTQNISENASAITTITETTIPNLKTELSGQITKSINAANAMTFQKTVSAPGDLPTTGVRVGDTYVVGKAFGTYHPADLLIAKGTEDANGVITSGLEWEVVKTGYSTAYNPVMQLDTNATIALYDYAGTELGGVQIKSASKNVTITNDNGAISIGLQWGSFTD